MLRSALGSAVQIVGTVLFAVLLGPIAVSQNQGRSEAALGQAMAVVNDVRIVHDHAGAAIQIVSTRPVVPTIESKDAPPRLIIDLPNTRSGMQHNRINVLQENILAIRTEEHPAEHISENTSANISAHISERQEKPPILRIVVSFLVPYGYAWEAEGSSVIVRLKPPEDPYVASRRAEAQRAQAAALKPTAAAAVVPVTSGVGDVLMADRRFAAGSSITAGSQTAVLQLARGGEVRVCPGTALSVTPSKSTKDLMIGLSTGAMETHYSLATSADTILTPDFRILLAGPGQFNYAISSDSKGTTCVRGLPGNASSAIVSELIGDRVYQVKPNEQAVFHDGRIDKVDSDVPQECGCPAPVPVMRAETGPVHVVPDSNSPNLTLAQNGSTASSHGVEPSVSNSGTPDNEGPHTFSSGPETQPLPRIASDQPHVQIEAPLVFRGRGNSASPPGPAKEAESLPATDSSRTITLSAQVLPPAPTAKTPPTHHSVLQRIRGFFAGIFR
ncbi:MAG: hypothetical protein WA252_14605 [Candidatus Sulfotelmatobacter sp.]